MKNILYTITLSFLFSFSVFAEWSKIAEIEEGVLYVDTDTIERNNGRIYIWSLSDFKINYELLGALSLTTLIEFDCNNIPKRHRVISINSYSGNMGEGELLYSESNEMESDWQYSPPNTTYSELANKLCKL